LIKVIKWNSWAMGVHNAFNQRCAPWKPERVPMCKHGRWSTESAAPSCLFIGSNPTSISLSGFQSVVSIGMLWYYCVEMSGSSTSWLFFTTASMKMTATWDVVPCSLVKVGRRFINEYCHHHQGDGGGLLWTRRLTNSVAREPEGSSPNSQQLVTGPYPEPVESNPHPQPFSLRSILIHPPICALVFQVVSFLRAFPPKPCTHFSPLPCVPHALPTSFAVTWCA
jgi:hypothetical protein